jgi:uncharacterized repeat protein (TIGR01451 family)
MTRNLLASGLAVCTILTSAAFAQVYTDQATPDQRVSQLRPGWSREGVDPATARARYVVAPAPIHLVNNEEEEGSSHSFLPNWFGWRYNKPEQQSNQGSNQNSNSNQQRPNVIKKANPQRKPNGNMNGAESSPPDPATMQDGPLPGMGGSPMPRSGGYSPNNSSMNRQDDSTSPNMSSRTTQHRPQSSLMAPSAKPDMRTASREPLADITDSTLDGNTSSPSTTRSSPGHRTAPHITPEELRRELSGTFPAPATTGDATSHADRKSSRPGDMRPDDGEAVVSDAPMALPTTRSAKEETAAKSMPAAQPKALLAPSDASPRSAAEAFGSTQHGKSAYGTGNSVRMPFASAPMVAPQAIHGKEAFGEALQTASGGDPNVLASSQTPVLNADIRGPKQILVGREAVYRVHLQNQSDVPAEGIVATVRIPAGAEVMNTTATQGTVQPGQDSQSAGQLQWRIARLDHRAGETLEIHLVPHESRPLELGISWTVAPVGSRAVVEVQEAKLNLEIAGPNEVLFDKPQVFKLTITNPGTGTAENVNINLLPPGGGQEAASSHPLGDLAAGASQTVEVELIPRDAGKIAVKATATAEGGLTCDASKEIFCRKPELEVDSRGPATKYAGTMATYYIRVRNPGTAPAEDITVRASLPEGAEFASASEGQSYDAQHREVVWRAGTLGPGDDNYMELKCVLKSPGKNVVKMAAANSAGDLTENKIAETNVIAIADLKLDVSDPSGPIAVGTQTMYEIHIRNRGASAAKDVNAVALFSEGIEPEQAEGAMCTVSDGRVTFHAIEELAAGREVVLRIRAHATQPGTHVFRAEVVCRDLEIKLSAEETTRFYADDVSPTGDQPQKEAAARSNAFGSKVK